MIREMVSSDWKLDQVTIISIISYFTIEPVVSELHGYALRNGYESTSVVANALISAYGKWGRMSKARRVFESSTVKDRVSWNTIISC